MLRVILSYAILQEFIEVKLSEAVKKEIMFYEIYM